MKEAIEKFGPNAWQKTLQFKLLAEKLGDKKSIKYFSNCLKEFKK